VQGEERSLWWRLGAPLARSIERTLFRVVVDGAEHVPATGPAVLAFNHVSVLDGPCLAIETSLRCRRQIRFLVAAEVFGSPFFGWVLRRFSQIPIRRGQGDRGALDAAIETVRAGAVAALAPEGRVNPDPSNGLQRIRSGIARIALPAGAPVVPVGIWGTHRRWPQSGPSFRRLWRRPVLAFVFGEPLAPAGDPNSAEDIDAFRERVGSAIEAQVVLAARAAGGTIRERPR
jgi:1-acyl-sn-glycerol-3-phosphate acyltransferase